MNELKQKDLMKYIVMILLFVLYTVFIPTISLDRSVKVILDTIFLLGALYAFKDEFKRGFRETRKHPGKFLLSILGFWLVSMIASGVINNVIVNFLNVETPNNDAQMTLWKNAPTYLCFSMLIFSPIIEELALTIATKKIIKNKWFYLLASGLLCGVLYVAFSATGSYLFMISYFVQEVVWAYAYLKTENALVPIGIHLIQNIITIVGFMVLL